MGDIVFCTFYLLLFSFIVLQASLFKLPGINNKVTLGAFYLKLGFGLLLWYIYAYHYKNRYTSDIFKYFDDAKLMYASIHGSTGDFFRMLFGVDDSSERIQGYYHTMASWVNAHNSTVYNNSHFIIRLNALLMPISQGHYGVHVLFFCFFSFVGMALLYKAFYPLLADKAYLLFAAIFLFPSVLLWSSGILKEGLVFLGLGLSIYAFRNLLSKFSAGQLVLFLLGLAIVYEAKAYVLLCLVPGFIAELWLNKTKILASRPWLVYGIVITAYLLIGFNINLLVPSINPLANLADKQSELKRLAKGGIYMAEVDKPNLYAYIPAGDSTSILPASTTADSLLKTKGIQYLTTASFCYREENSGSIVPYKLKPGIKYLQINTDGNDTSSAISNDSIIYRLDTYIEPAKSAVYLPTLQPTITSLLKNVPSALVVSVIRPFPGEIKSAAVLIYFFENVAILALIVLAFVFRKRQGIHTNMVAFCLSYCLLMLVLIGISTPLYGGIERYKSVVIPFMLILLLLISDGDKIKTILKRK